MTTPPRGTRGYLRDYPPTWTYRVADPGAPPPTPPGEGGGQILVPINWDGLAINVGNLPDGFTAVVTNVEGWLDSPPLDGHDTDRGLADGSAYGPKVLGGRDVLIEGAAVGPRPQLGAFRDQLAARAAARQPAPLSITDGGLERTLVADVRAGTERYRQSWISPIAFRWQVTVHAADPLLYEDTWQQAVLITTTAADTGRRYEPFYSWDGTASGGWWPPRTDGQPGPGPEWTPPAPPPGWDDEVDGPWSPEPPAAPKDPTIGETRAYPNWRYSAPWTPNSAVLTNNGNTDAPVWALYEGDLTATRLTDDLGGLILMDAMPTDMRIVVATKTLAAEAEGGLSRASFIQAGSRPMVLPPGSTRWHLYGAGYGRVTLAWRSAWV